MKTIRINFSPKHGLSYAAEVDDKVVEDENALYEVAEEIINNVPTYELEELFKDALMDGFTIYDVEEL